MLHDVGLQRRCTTVLITEFNYNAKCPIMDLSVTIKL
jgi:hypothetical protein